MTDVLDHIHDILEAAEKIQRYTDGMTRESFIEDDKTVDAVLRNFEVIGEPRRTSPNESARSTTTCPGRRWPGCGTS